MLVTLQISLSDKEVEFMKQEVKRRNENPEELGGGPPWRSWKELAEVWAACGIGERRVHQEQTNARQAREASIA